MDNKKLDKNTIIKIVIICVAVLAIVGAVVAVVVHNKKSKSNDTTAATSNTTTDPAIDYSDPKVAFSDVKLVNKEDETNVLYLKKDGTYVESYKGSLLYGEWKVNDDGFLYLILGEGENATQYQFEIKTDSDNIAIGLSQYEGRSFDITERSVPEKIEAIPYESTKPAETTKSAE